jgi:hypothetical protein
MANAPMIDLFFIVCLLFSGFIFLEVHFYSEVEATTLAKHSVVNTLIEYVVAE